MNSMTGFGAVEVVSSPYRVRAQVRSVNSRFLDVTVLLPAAFVSYEREVQQAVQERFVRGKVDVKADVADDTSRNGCDIAAAIAYRDDIVRLTKELHLARPTDEKLLELVLAHEAVSPACLAEDSGDARHSEDSWSAIMGAIDEALDKCAADRAREGEALRQDLAGKIDVLDMAEHTFEEWMPRMEERLRAMVVERFAALLGDDVDMNRVMQEVAALMVRYTINEEVVRLRSHITALRTELDGKVAGKRLDFICQEAGREINTIGSKNPFADIAAVVVDAKDALEAIREQARNVE